MASTFQPSKWAARGNPSQTVAIGNLAKQSRTDDLKYTVNLSMGEPDFDPRPNILQAQARAALHGPHKYSSPKDGTTIAAIQYRVEQDYGFKPDASWITFGNGLKELIRIAFMVTLDPGQRFVTPSPSWVSYGDIAQQQEAELVLVYPKDRTLEITPDQLEQALVPENTRLLMVNAPSNPAGVTYGKQTVAEFAEVIVTALKKNPLLIVAVDDIYSKLYFDDAFHSFYSAIPEEFRDRLILMNGLSKSHAYTGHRFGYVVAHPELIKHINAAISQSTTSMSPIIQAGAVEALTAPEDFLVEWRETYRTRLQMMCNSLNAMGLSCAMPGGAFYLYPEIDKALEGTGKTDKDFTMDLLTKGGVAGVFGSAFHNPPGMSNIRFSCAASDETLTEAGKRIEHFVKHIWRTRC